MTSKRKVWNPYDYCKEIGMTEAEAVALSTAKATKIKIDMLYENKYGKHDTEPDGQDTGEAGEADRTDTPAVPEDDTGTEPDQPEDSPPETSPSV